jgi:hypothetical protein
VRGFQAHDLLVESNYGGTVWMSAKRRGQATARRERSTEETVADHSLDKGHTTIGDLKKLNGLMCLRCPTGSKYRIYASPLSASVLFCLALTASRVPKIDGASVSTSNSNRPYPNTLKNSPPRALYHDSTVLLNP